jgi:hypothetical protein
MEWSNSRINIGQKFEPSLTFRCKASQCSNIASDAGNSAAKELNE